MSFVINVLKQNFYLIQSHEFSPSQNFFCLRSLKITVESFLNMHHCTLILSKIMDYFLIIKKNQTQKLNISRKKGKRNSTGIKFEIRIKFNGRNIYQIHSTGNQIFPFQCFVFLFTSKMMSGRQLRNPCWLIDIYTEKKSSIKSCVVFVEVFNVAEVPRTDGQIRMRTHHAKHHGIRTRCGRTEISFFFFSFCWGSIKDQRGGTCWKSKI